MEENGVPLTPAEQMRRIREKVLALDERDAKDAHSALVAYFSRLDSLRARLTDLEGKMLLVEQPFVSHTRILGRFIVWFRTAWNWMSTKWYVQPLIARQNAYNMAVTQALREVIAAVECLAAAVQDLQMQMARLEQPGGQRTPPDRSDSECASE